MSLQSYIEDHAYACHTAEQGCQAIADKWQGQSRVGQNLCCNSYVDERLESNQGRHPNGNQPPADIFSPEGSFQALNHNDMTESRPTTMMLPTNPVSSPTTEKMKSVCCSETRPVSVTVTDTSEIVLLFSPLP